MYFLTALFYGNRFCTLLLFTVGDNEDSGSEYVPSSPDFSSDHSV